MNTIISENESPVFSYFKKPVSNTKPFENIDLIKVHKLITGDSFKQITLTLRNITEIKEARYYKSQNFDYVTFAGVFSVREDNAIINPSGLMVIDFDHIKDIPTLKQSLLNDPHLETELLFISPSGDGLKWIISIDLSQANYNDFFIAVSNYLRYSYHIEADKSGKNLSRACFLPYDPTAYINQKHLYGKENI